MTRTVELLPVPTGPDLLAVLPRLAAAMTGAGPALAPAAAGHRAQIELLTRAFGVGEPLHADEDDPADPTVLVVATSGSTGVPKGSLLTRSALAASAAATQRRIGPTGNWLLALPAQHIAGLQVLLRSLATGTTPHILDTGRTFTAGRFVAAVEPMPDGPRYVSLVPTQLQRVLADDAATEALSTFTSVLVGGAATAAALLQRARRAGVAVVTTYGMSETCGGCVYDGLPLDGAAADLDESGRVTLTGPMVGRGYRKLPRHPAFGRPHAFRTDDAGEWVDGRLRIIGRLDDVIVTGGLKVAPGRLEEAIARLTGVAEVVVVGVPDLQWGHRVTAVIVTADPSRPPTLEEVRNACAAAGIERGQQPHSLTVVSALPLRGPGKPDRAAAAALAAGRRLAGEPGVGLIAGGLARTPPVPG